MEQEYVELSRKRKGSVIGNINRQTLFASLLYHDIIPDDEINFAKEVGDRILFMDSGKVIETSTPDIFFLNAKHERSRKFLNQIRNK